MCVQGVYGDCKGRPRIDGMYENVQQTAAHSHDALEEKYLQKFKALYQETHHQELSDTEALGYFRDLVTLVRAVYRPRPRAESPPPKP